MSKTLLAILKVLDSNSEIIGSRSISKQLKTYGVDLSERTVRYHLKILDERGLTQVFGKEGRKITDEGRQELKDARVSEKVGFIISRIENFASLTSFDIETMRGNVILNISFFPQKHLTRALKVLKLIFESPYITSDKIFMAFEEQKIGDHIIPKGIVCLGTVCSVTINGIFLKHGIPVTSKFGGVLETSNGELKRFTSLISYEGSSIDPLEIFIKSKMTDVISATKNRSGKILASFREIPVACLEKARSISEQLAPARMGSILSIGNPNEPFLEMPVSMDRVGLVIIGGLNPVAALEESNIPTNSHAMSILYEYSEMEHFNTYYRRLS